MSHRRRGAGIPGRTTDAEVIRPGDPEKNYWGGRTYSSKPFTQPTENDDPWVDMPHACWVGCPEHGSDPL